METTPTPLPKFQLFLTLLIQISEPITAMVIYPFITRAVRRTGITEGDEKKTGYYAGIIESAFFLAECLTVFHWGRASDRHGRRPILLLGPLGLAMAMFGFGLSNAFWAMVLFRCAMGMFNGNIGVSKTVMAEMTDETNRADAFTLMPIIWAVGTTIGPTLGGVLADPAVRWPDIFGKLSFFQDFPYFLSCASAGAIAFAAFALSYLGLKETAPSKRRSQASEGEAAPLLAVEVYESPSTYGTTSGSDFVPTPSPPKATPVRKLLDSKLRPTILSLGILSFTGMCYDVLIPLVYSTTISVGGLGLTPYQIGLILGIFGLFNGAWNWFVLTRILKKLGPRKTFIVGYAFFLIHFAMLGILREAAGRAGKVTPFVWFLLLLQLFFSTMTNVAFNAIHLLVVFHAPADSLGAVNGLGQMMSSGARGIAPVFASSLFSISLESHVAGGHLVEIVLIGVTIVGIFCTLQLPH